MSGDGGNRLSQAGVTVGEGESEWHEKAEGQHWHCLLLAHACLSSLPVLSLGLTFATHAIWPSLPSLPLPLPLFSHLYNDDDDDDDGDGNDDQ